MLKKGDRVRVTHHDEGVVTDPFGDGTFWYRSSKTGDKRIVSLRDLPNVEVLEPDNWPPKVGDVWATDDGDEWVALKHNLYTTLMVNLDHTIRPEREPDQFKTMNPTLVRRRNVLIGGETHNG